MDVLGVKNYHKELRKNNPSIFRFVQQKENDICSHQMHIIISKLHLQRGSTRTLPRQITAYNLRPLARFRGACSKGALPTRHVRTPMQPTALQSYVVVVYSCNKFRLTNHNESTWS